MSTLQNRALWTFVMAVGGLWTGLVWGADEEVFSGPQPGEKMAPFKVLGVYDDAAGKEVDFVSQAEGKPLMLIFIHDPLTRPSASVARGLAEYAKAHNKDLKAGIVWLAPDRSKSEEYLKMARRSLNFGVPVGISLDGLEGPGAYGLNRNVSLTIVIGKENKVTANFALIQPSTTDAPKILTAAAKLFDGPAVTQADFDKLAGGRMTREAAPDAQLSNLLRGVIQKDLEAEKVNAAAAAVDEYVEKDEARRKQLGDVAHRVSTSDKFGNYGTEVARKHLLRWAEKYGPKQENKQP